MRQHLLIAFFSLFCVANMQAQTEDSMLDLLGEEETTDYTTASFKTTRVINLHSLENVAEGVLDFKINHRFGTLNGGFYELFGLDNASTRFSFDYGITNELMVGVGRSSFEKTYDGFIKYKFLRQSKGKRNMPFTAIVALGSAIETIKPADPNRDNFFSNKVSYYSQIIIGKKFSESFSLELAPTMVHRNLVKTNAEKNDVYSLGIGARYKLSKRISINGEYIYVAPNQLADNLQNSLSVGVDIETGGHVFQLHFTNSVSMIEKGFIAQNTSSWSDGGIHYGFNISRVFTLKERK